MKELKRFIILFFIPLHFSISGNLNAQMMELLLISQKKLWMKMRP
jgi:hypothetical protein